MFTILDIDQRSPEWVTARLGRLTSSTANDILAKGRGNEESTMRRNLRIRLALERVTGKSGEKDFTRFAMQQGIEREPEAFAAYEAISGRLLVRTGFLRGHELMVGCSLDGHSERKDFSIEGVTEIKCPLAATHWEYLRTSKVPLDYLRQITHQLWISGAEWCDWMSYNPDFPERLQAKLVRVLRAEVDLELYDREARRFLAEVENEELAIRTMAEGVRVAV